MHNPDLLVLDEPLSGFDIASAQLFKCLLKELAAAGKMILFISHVLETVEKICEKVVIIYKGEIRASPFRRASEDPDAFALARRDFFPTIRTAGF